MLIIRTLPHKIYNCEEIVECFWPEICARLKWTPENNYNTDGPDEKKYILNDNTLCSAGWRVRDGIPIPPNTKVLEDIKVDKLKEIVEARNIAIDITGTEYNGLHVWTDKGSKGDIQFAITAFDKTGKLPNMWKAKDGLIVINIIDDILGIAIAIGEYVENQYAHEFGLIEQVNACTTIEQVEAIKW